MNYIDSSRENPSYFFKWKSVMEIIPSCLQLFFLWILDGDTILKKPHYKQFYVCMHHGPV